MTVKLAVKRFSSGRSRIGDVIQAFPSDIYLGDKVEPKGGAFSIIIVEDADIEDPVITELEKQWWIKNPKWSLGDTQETQYILNPDYDRRYHLQPVTEGSSIFSELLDTGRYTTTLEELKTFIRDRDA